MLAKFNNKSGGNSTLHDSQKLASMTNSRLGQILVNRGYVTQKQLDLALRQQAEAVRAGRGEALRLGELLVAQSLISERDLRRALKQQSRLRFAATVLAAISAPLQPMLAMAATTTAPVIVPAPKPTETVAAKGYMIAGLQPMAESEMAGITAQGFDERLATRLDEQTPIGYEADKRDIRKASALESEQGLDGVKVLGQLGKVLLPITQVLDSDIEVVGVHISDDRIKPLFDDTGAMNVILPNLIERVSFRDIRPAGQVGGPTFGTIQLEGIRFSDEASIKIRPF